MRLCIVYDCLFPYSVGGAERWYRNLALRLAEDGHEVTYLTLRQWGRDERPELAGVDVRAVGPRFALYKQGRRRILPPLVFGIGVLAHLLVRGRRYEVIHTASFPYFSVLAAAAARAIHRFELVVDWHEVWTETYWRDYLGGVAGRIGSLVQRLCLRVRQEAFCFSRLHEGRLRAAGVRGPVHRLTGEYDDPGRSPEKPAAATPRVVFAGRHIPEKRVGALVPAIAEARRDIPELTCRIYGDGPDRPQVIELIREHRLEDAIAAPGFVPWEEIDDALRHALCMVLPSQREGYGLVVIEAAAVGTPSVVVADPDNAAAELVETGTNGFVAESAAPAALADAIRAVHEGGEPLRRATLAWYREHADELSIQSSLDVVGARYRAVAGG